MSQVSPDAPAGSAAVSSPAAGPPLPDARLHYHLMGIGGIGVSAFARLLLARGARVSGCDAQTSELTEQLAREGVTVYAGHDAAHVQGDVDVLVASEAVPKDHPELVAARELEIQVMPRMALLGELLAAEGSVGVIGTHGKTTTTSMIAVALEGAGLDPAAFVGGIVPNWDSNARVGQGPFVAEVDESDPQFQYLRCGTSVFTNAEDDHVGTVSQARATYWSSVEELTAAFQTSTRHAGRVLYCADWPGLKELVAGHPNLVSYGTGAEADYRAEVLARTPEGTGFTVWRGPDRLGELSIPMPGEHNMLNALAALAVNDLHGGAFGPAAQALSAFAGPGRRWQRVGELNGAAVYDDYAHNPTKVAAAIEGARQSGRRVRVVFQPHRYLRTQQTWPRLAVSLMPADEVLILDIAAASEAPIEGVHARLIEERMASEGHPNAHYYPQRQAVLDHLRATATAEDLIVTMGAGDVWQVARDLAGVAR